MYIQMQCLVYGLHYAAMTPWNIAYMATDRVPKGIAATHGHLASLTRIRSQFSGNHATGHLYETRYGNVQPPWTPHASPDVSDGKARQRTRALNVFLPAVAAVQTAAHGRMAPDVHDAAP
jgi:hypothetical protein